MRRALIATAGTAAAVAALLSYKSSNALKVSATKISLGAQSTTVPPATTTVPTTAPHFGSPSPSTTPSTSGDSGGGGKTLTGTDVQYPYGELQLRVTETGGKITQIDVVQNVAPDPRSEHINAQALAILIPEAVRAQGTNIDAVSGATFTSEAFAQALQSAIDPSGT